MEDELSLGEWLRDTRIEKDIPLRALARQMEIAPSYLSDIENNRRVPTEEILRKFAKALGLDFEDAMARAGRFGEETESYVRRRPEAVKLFRRVSAANLSAEDLQKLSKQVPDMKPRNTDQADPK